MKKIVVVGIGNILLGDEGFGVKVVEELRKLELPENVEIYDGATLGLQILNFLDNADFAIIVDAVKAGGKPGELFVFEIGDAKNRGPMLSMHDLDLVKAIEIGKLAYNLPERILVVGVEPEKIEESFELSEKVKNAIPKAVSKVLELINSA
ncbi:hydrogenase maturation protease [Archaeoglobus veneficus]|uniref:Hydrogenase maturation protease n=1 Tax=Archaeoglobus veneficus (strain DSM 11195 / SNP6) TaxID=693661 RepID=F2KN78_ARCVS|nr:hydrogenase maturation protease [Archaeoglobus veneficus]AEA46179.1 hydrogenase maturation protease [Archaeoglobus veneficus SNP6]